MFRRHLFTILFAGAVAVRTILQLSKLRTELAPESISHDLKYPVLKKKKKEEGDASRSSMPLSFDEATVPFPNASTLALFSTKLYSGFRNEAMAFTAFVLCAAEHNFTQILLPSLRWKDLFGTNRPVLHEHLFDVVHWNSFFPSLPRFVSYDPVAHRDFNIKTLRWNIESPEVNASLCIWKIPKTNEPVQKVHETLAKQPGTSKESSRATHTTGGIPSPSKSPVTY